jgi:hypothetical protein
MPTLERSINHLKDRDIADIAYAAPEGEIALAAGAHPDGVGDPRFLQIHQRWFV